MSVQLAEPPTAHSHPNVMSDEPLYEIVDGKKVEVQPLAMLSNRVGTKILSPIIGYLEKNPLLGCVISEGLFHMPVTDNDRRPDIAYLSAQRYPLDDSLEPEGDFPVPPDLAIEIVSPKDKSENVKEKIHEYFQNDVKQV